MMNNSLKKGSLYRLKHPIWIRPPGITSFFEEQEIPRGSIVLVVSHKTGTWQDTIRRTHEILMVHKDHVYEANVIDSSHDRGRTATVDSVSHWFQEITAEEKEQQEEEEEEIEL